LERDSVNFYPHHIGDFDKATRHSSRLERSIYRDLMDLYYDTEAPLSLDSAWLCKKIIARSNEESTAVEQVLNEFFTKTPTGWYHERCEEEISKYHANNSQKSQAGKASAAAKALKKQQALNGKSTAVETPVERTSNGTSTNQEPLTNNQEPKRKSAPAPHLAVIPEKLLKDFLAVRKAKRAGELTETALAGIQREADKAGLTLIEVITACCEYSWAGFDADWYAKRHNKAGTNGSGLNKQEALEASNAAVAKRFLEKGGYAAQ
jgi:uncharacterized protein YdaU (DUF1376 family)